MYVHIIIFIQGMLMHSIGMRVMLGCYAQWGFLRNEYTEGGPINVRHVQTNNAFIQ